MSRSRSSEPERDRTLKPPYGQVAVQDAVDAAAPTPASQSERSPVPLAPANPTRERPYAYPVPNDDAPARSDNPNVTAARPKPEGRALLDAFGFPFKREGQ